jgi:aminoglycoside phosphotransferase (APT) family kinase protein
MPPGILRQMALGRLIGRGRTAEVFEWDDGQVVKLFYADMPATAIDREMRCATALSGMTIPAPRFGGQIQIGERSGLVFEHVRGRSMLSELSRQPWRTLSMASQMADLHVQLHAVDGADLPSQHSYVQERIQRAPGISEPTRAAALERLNALDQGRNRVCHGDFHPDNIIMTSRGPVVVDWMNAARGAPAGDVARTLLLVEYAPLPAGTGAALRLAVTLLRRALVRAYWRRYAERTGLRRASVDAWRLPLAAARLAENVPPGEKAALLELCHAEVK